MRKILLILICIFLGSTYAYTIDITTHYLGTGATYWNLPDTGQTTSYDTGDDSDYQPADSQQSYTAKTISGGDVVVDNRTGLMWVQDPETDLAGEPDWPGTMNWQTALSACEGLTFAGYDDWRLPNVKELFSIAEKEGTEPFINAIFSCESGRYWTSTSGSPGRALVVSFNSSYVSRYDKPLAYYVRPVRGGP